MVRLNELITKITEAKTLYSPYGEKDAKVAFYNSKGIVKPTNDAIDRYITNISYGVGAEGKNSRRSNDVTNRSAITNIASIVSSLVKSGKIKPRRDDKDLLKRNTRITEEKLRVFDFDDTVATSKSRVGIRNNKTGRTRKLSPSQFSRYRAKSHEQTDFSEFDRVIKPQRIKEIHTILKNLSKKKRTFMILTARGNRAKKPIQKYLEREGLYHPERVRITTVGSSTPSAKSNIIKKHLNTGKYSHLEFFDDNHENVTAVSSLKDEYPHIKIKTRHVKYGEK